MTTNGPRSRKASPKRSGAWPYRQERSPRCSTSAVHDAPDYSPRADLTRMQIALFQPDIPQNTGTILRLCACLDVEAHIIEPAGFPVTDRHFRRSGMDYLDQVKIVRHVAWREFETWRRDAGLRLLLLTTRASRSYLDCRYGEADILLLGRESAGVPDEVFAAADERLLIPMQGGMRSLNVAMAAAMALGEALRQTGTPEKRA